MRLLILLAIMLSSTTYALEFNDIINKLSVIKAYDDNYLVLNRGLEDGIIKGDHIKLTNENGYIARAICIKASMLLSHWKVYRVVNPELLSFDDYYVLKSMNQSEIPDELKDYRYADFSQEFNDITDADAMKPVKIQQDRIATFDLGNDMSNDPAIIAANMSETEKFIGKNFDGQQFANDFANMNLSVYTSPISWQRQNDQKSINYGLSLSNYGQKYELSFNANKMETKTVDQYTQTEVTSESTNASIVFDINHITEDFTYFMFASYAQARNGQTYYPRKQYQGGLLGLKYHIVDGGETVQKFDISYITIIDYIEYDTEESYFDEDTFEFVTNKFLAKERNARHSFRLRLRAALTESLFLNSVYWYKPLMFLKNQKMDWEDNQTNWTTDVTWNITEKFSASYQYQYTYDIRLMRDYQVDPMNQINTINLNYSFNL